jgi:hypothetical protein
MTKFSTLPALALCAGALLPAAATQAQTSPPATQAQPPRVVVLPVEQVGSTEPGPQSPEAARHEAAAAMAEARRLCRLEPDRQSRADCLSDARDDRDQLLEAARGGRVR